MAINVAGVIEPALQAAEVRRSAARPTMMLRPTIFICAATRWPCYRQHGSLRRSFLWSGAIERDPHYGPALAWAAVCYLRLLSDDRSEDPAADRLRGADFARRALAVAEDDPGVLANAAFALAYFGEDIDTMMALIDHVLALNPSFARGWHISGTVRLWAGKPDIAIEHVNTATAPQSPRPHRHVACCIRRRPFGQPAL